MNVFITLLKREYWEHKGSVLVLPLAISGFLIALIFLASMLVASGGEHILIQLDGGQDGILLWEDEEGNEYEYEYQNEDGTSLVNEVMLEKLAELASFPEPKKRRIVQKSLTSVALLMFLAMWGVIFFYLLSSLYEDRKDRSILFWKSMPVSDAMTLASKLVTAMLVIPAIVIGCIMVVHLVMLIAATLLVAGEGINIWQTFWVPSDLFSLWAVMIIKMIYLCFWALPFFGWLVLVSASTKSNPLAWAIGIPIGLLILEKVSFMGDNLASWISRHGVAKVGFLVNPDQNWSDVSASLISLDMLSALIVGAAAIAGAWWMRSRSEEL